MTASQLQRVLVLTVVMAGTTMTLLDIAVVNVALPNVMVSLGANVVEVRWVVTAFMLVSALVMPITGWLGRRLGYGQLYIISLFFFTAGTGFCALAWSLDSLIVARVVQAIGAGILQSTGMALLTRAFPAHQRGRAIGIWGASLAIGPAIGPVTGGWLVEEESWRAVFMLNVPIGIAAILFALAVLERTRDDQPPRFDWLGYAAIVMLLTAFLITLDQGNELGWGSEWIRFGFFVTGVTFVSVLLLEYRLTNALVPLRLFRIRDFSLAMWVGLIRSAGMFASFFLQPLFLQQVQGRDAVSTGLMVIPAAVSFAVGMPIAGWLTDRMGGRWPTVAGAVIAAVSYLMYYNLDSLTNNFGIILPQVIRGIGMSLVMSPAMTVGLNSVPRDDAGTASWMLNIAQRFGGSITVAMLANFLHAGTMVEQDRLGGVATLRSPLVGMKEWALGLGHSRPNVDSVARAVYQWDVGQAATIISYENVFVGVGWVLLLIIPPALLFSRQRAARA